jgi:hypothetical protein
VLGCLDGLILAQVGVGCGPLGQPSRWLLGSEPMRVLKAGRGPVLAAGPNPQAVNSKSFLFNFSHFRSIIYLFFLVCLLFFHLS